MEQHSADREALKVLQALFETAVEKNDMESFSSHISKDFSIVSFTDRVFPSYAAYCEQWKKTRLEMVGPGTFKTALNPNLTQFYGDTAVAHGCSANHLQDRKGKQFEFTSNWTVIFRKEDEQWKVVRAHSSLDPFNNPMAKHAVKKILFGAVIAAGGVGVLLGWLLAS